MQRSTAPLSFFDNLEAIYYAVNWRQDAVLFTFLALLPTTLLLLLWLTPKSPKGTWEQVITYTSMGLIAAAQPINKVASLNWRSIASQNYFDKHGLFISLFWSGPLMVVALVGLTMTLMNVWGAMGKLAKTKVKAAKKKDDPKSE